MHTAEKIQVAPADPAEKSLPVMETFVSIQGEGFHTGIPAFFIRFGGCDIGCHWCDVKESWNAGDHPSKPISGIVKEAESAGIKNIVITGGEPLIHDLTSLTRALKKKGFTLHLETSGAYPLSGEWDWICLSPKKVREPLPEIFPKADELKMIIFNRDDFQFAEKCSKYAGRKCVLYLQPEWTRKDAMLPEMIRHVHRDPKWRISLQTHKYIGIP